MNVSHPGEILSEYQEGKSIEEFAKELGIPKELLNQLLECRIAVTTPVARLLAGTLDTTVEFWLNLQKNYDKVLPRNE